MARSYQQLATKLTSPILYTAKEFILGQVSSPLRRIGRYLWICQHRLKCLRSHQTLKQSTKHETVLRLKVLVNLPCAADTDEKLAKIWFACKTIAVLPNSFHSLLMEARLRQECSYEDVDYLLVDVFWKSHFVLLWWRVKLTYSWVNFFWGAIDAWLVMNKLECVPLHL